MSDGDALIRLSGITKTYGGGQAAFQALKGIDLAIEAGDFVAVMGPSGSGKSTVMNILGCLDTPTSGSYEFEGARVEQLTRNERALLRRHYLGFVFQFYNLIPSLTARENVEVVTEIATHPMGAAEALALVGLGDRVDAFPAQLSGGQQQRVAIARAIAKQPEVLLCDEPTGALDSETGVRVLEALSDVNQRLGTTTVVITHNAGIAAMAHRVIHLSDGRIVSVEQNAERRRAGEISW